MSNKESTFSFVYDWMKNSGIGSSLIVVLRFSEGLLKILYYETDIGSIPRGAHPESYPTSKAKYQNNPNWSKHIMGCYWCGRDSTVVNGICCSKDCILYFHEWCVERVELFQGRRFCKLPGCDLSPTEANYVCCSRSHNREYEQMFEFVNKKQLRDLVIKGPYWYNCEHSFDETPPVLTHYTYPPVAETAVRDLAKQMKSTLTNTENTGKSNKHSTPDITGLNIQNTVNIPQHSQHMKRMKSVTNPVPCPIQSQYSAVPISKSLTTPSNQNENVIKMKPFTKLPQSSTPDITGLNIQNTANIPQYSQHSQHLQHSQYMKRMKSVTNPVPCPIQSQYSAVPISKSLTTPSNQNENIFKMNPYTIYLNLLVSQKTSQPKQFSQKSQVKSQKNSWFQRKMPKISFLHL